MSRSTGLRFTGLRFIAPLVAASALVLASAGGALAKCEHNTDAGTCEGVTATLDPGGTLTAGGPTTVGIWVLEDEQPYEANRVEVVFSRVADGTIVRVAASPAEPEGRWEAVVNLPEGGTWTAAATVQGPEYAGNFALDTLHVDPPAAAAAAGTGTTNAASAPSLPVLPWVLVLTLAAGLAGAAILARRQTSTAQG